MKRILYVILIIISISTITGCSIGGKPESVVKSFNESMKKIDIDKMGTYTVKGFDSEINMKYEVNEGNSIDKFMESNIGKVKYTIKESKINGKKAVVTVNYQYIDASPILRDTLEEYVRQGFSMAFMGASESMLEQLAYNIFEEKAELATPKFMKKTVEFKCVKTEDGWKIENVPDELVDVMTCNMYDIINGFTDSIEKGFGNDAKNTSSEEEIIWNAVELGNNVELSTVRIKLTNVEEKEQLQSNYKSTSAKSGTKFILVGAEIENITSNPITFSNDLILLDREQGRTYNPYNEAYSYVDNSFFYEELAPNIKEIGILVYNVPIDVNHYSLLVGKAGTNLGYELIIKD